MERLKDKDLKNNAKNLIEEYENLKKKLRKRKPDSISDDEVEQDSYKKKKIIYPKYKRKKQKKGWVK